MALMYTKCLQNRLVLRNLPSTFAKIAASGRQITIKAEPVKENATVNEFERNNKLGRPLSPHLTIYAFQLTSVLSISHRFAGIALAGYATTLGVGALVLPHDISYYIAAIEGLQLSAPTLVAAKFAIGFPFVYHTANGVRHLLWDLGKFLTIKEVYATGYAMLIASVIGTGVLSVL